MKRTEKTTARTFAALLACLAALSAAGCRNETSGSSPASSATEQPQTSAAASSITEQPQASSAAEQPQTSAAESSAEESAAESTPTENTGLWAGASFTEDTWVGEGTYTVLIEVKIEEKSITFTVKSDKDNLAEILTESGIAEGEESAYGLYIKTVNGVRADYDLDKAYWALNKDGTAAPTGASDITVKDGEHYELVYTPA